MKYLPLLICASIFITGPAMAQDNQEVVYGEPMRKVLQEADERSRQLEEDRRQDKILEELEEIREEQKRERIEDRRRDQGR